MQLLEVEHTMDKDIPVVLPHRASWRPVTIPTVPVAPKPWSFLSLKEIRVTWYENPKNVQHQLRSKRTWVACVVPPVVRSNPT